jgi:hydroxylaminobenzene mutase
MLLFLIGLCIGLFVHLFAVPRLALSAHLLAITQGLFVMIIGLLWPKLGLTRAWSRVALVLPLYGCLAALSANLLGAAWGAGNSMLPFAAGPAHGSVLQETIIKICLRTAAASLIAGSFLILWGLQSSRRGHSDK